MSEQPPTAAAGARLHALDNLRAILTPVGSFMGVSQVKCGQIPLSQN